LPGVPWRMVLLINGASINEPTSQELTQLLREWSRGSHTAQERMIPLVYDELRRMAKRQLRRQPPGNTLQTTALVHEAYLRLVDTSQMEWQDRAHFFAVAARAMRCLLVDRARARQAEKRGGGAQRVELDEAAAVSPEQSVDMLMLDEALGRLAALDQRQGQIVELRYFGGMSLEETAEALNLSAITVRREWVKAKAWLYRELSRGQTE
jgi:RNA polymerase sigma factor (TIGR02999 family)